MKRPFDQISPATRERLPVYYRALREFLLENRLRVNSTDLSRVTGFQPAQIRSDLKWNEGAAQRGYGYMVKELYTEIAAYLGTGAGYTAVCIGHELGATELCDGMFGRYGVRILAYLPEDREEAWLSEQLRHLSPDIGVVSAGCRKPLQNAALFRACHVKGILNYSDCHIDFPDLIVRNHSPSDDLLLLCSGIQSKEDKS